MNETPENNITTIDPDVMEESDSDNGIHNIVVEILDHLVKTVQEDPLSSFSDACNVEKDETAVSDQDVEEATINISFQHGSGERDDKDDQLKDTSLLFDGGENLTQPFIGFSEKQSAKLSRTVDEQSDMIFGVVSTMEDQLMEENLALILAHNDSVIIPRHLLMHNEGGDIKMRVFKEDTSTKINAKSKEDGLEVDEKTTEPFTLPLSKGWKREVVDEVVGKPNKLADHFKMKKRLFSVKSISTRRIPLPKRDEAGEILIRPKKTLSKSSNSLMQMGMLPPKYPKYTSQLQSGKEIQYYSPRRGRPPKPGGKRDLLIRQQAITAAKESAGMSESDVTDSMFQISAFNEKSHSLMEAAIEQYQQGFQENIQMNSDMDNSKNDSAPVEEENSIFEDEQNSKHLPPCSIMCPGRTTGEIPTLQCKSCLCLYHYECLGLQPLNLNFNGFLCSNCIEIGNPMEKLRDTVPPMPIMTMKPRKLIFKTPTQSPDKFKDLKLRSLPPPLIPINKSNSGLKLMSDIRARVPLPKMPPLQPLGRKPMTPSTLMPRLEFLGPMPRSLTVTPILMPQRLPSPDVSKPVGHMDRLQNRFTSAKPAWVSRNPNKEVIVKVMEKMKAEFHDDAIFKKPQNKKSVTPCETTVKSLQPQRKIINDKSNTQFENYANSPTFGSCAQGVVTIGQSKFIVVPRTSKYSTDFAL